MKFCLFVFLNLPVIEDFHSGGSKDIDAKLSQRCLAAPPHRPQTVYLVRSVHKPRQAAGSRDPIDRERVKRVCIRSALILMVQIALFGLRQ